MSTPTTRAVPGTRARAAAALVLWAALGSACGFTQMSNLAFRVDHRLSFLAPPARALVQNPVTVRWRMSDFDVEPARSAPPSRHGGYFAVFVDQAPIRPGQTMRAVAARDPGCLHRRGCPDADYLAARQIYTTTAESITLGEIPARAGDEERVQLHTVTVVLMDTSGHRIGESAWELDLRMRRQGL